jgi:protein O-GlcNAc transferase
LTTMERLPTAESGAATDLDTTELPVFLTELSQRYYEFGRRSHETGELVAARDALLRAVSLDPTLARAFVLLGVVQFDLRDNWAAAATLQHAIELEPHNSEARYYLGLACYRLGENDAAIEAFEDAVSHDPDHVAATWMLSLWLPQIYEDVPSISMARRRWIDGVNQLAAELDAADTRRLLHAVSTGTLPIFYLPYQGLEDRQLVERFGALVTRAVKLGTRDRAPDRAARTRRGPRRKPRIGFVSAHFRSHSVMRSHGRWVTDIDRSRFEVHVFHVTGTPDSSGTAQVIKTSADSYFRGTHPESIVSAISSKELDILIYLDIGMDARLYVPAALRLAPVQCATWGHPVSTGLPTIDYFLSAELTEPADAEQSYCEELVRLPNLGGSFPEPPRVESSPDAPGGTVVYLCSQSLFKLLPQYDSIYPEIAREVPNSRFDFLTGLMAPVAATFAERLQRSFLNYGLDWTRYCRMYPPMSYLEFLKLNQRSDVYLDSISWSGHNTALDAASVGLPLITFPGSTMRARHCYGILARLGLLDTVAPDLAGYIRMAADVGRDERLRSEISRQTRSRAPILFGDVEPIRALEHFLESCSQSPN